jgi:hypothetical protein
LEIDLKRILIEKSHGYCLQMHMPMIFMSLEIDLKTILIEKDIILLYRFIGRHGHGKQQHECEDV